MNQGSLSGSNPKRQQKALYQCSMVNWRWHDNNREGAPTKRGVDNEALTATPTSEAWKHGGKNSSKVVNNSTTVAWRKNRVSGRDVLNFTARLRQRQWFAWRGDKVADRETSLPSFLQTTFSTCNGVFITMLSITFHPQLAPYLMAYDQTFIPYLFFSSHLFSRHCATYLDAVSLRWLPVGLVNGVATMA